MNKYPVDVSIAYSYGSLENMWEAQVGRICHQTIRQSMYDDVVACEFD